MSEYLQVEDAYVRAFELVATGCGVDAFAIRSLEVGEALEEGAVLDMAEAKAVLRRMLRESVICRLESPDQSFHVHVGYDLYMYLGADCSADRAISELRGSPVFVEENVPSPYYHD